MNTSNITNYKPKDFAELLGVSVKTLQRWDREGTLTANRTPTIVVVNNEELSPQEELVQDIVSILHVFSCRLYGLRKYKKQIGRDEEIAKELQDGNKSNRRAENQDTQDDRNL